MMFSDAYSPNLLLDVSCSKNCMYIIGACHTHMYKYSSKNFKVRLLQMFHMQWLTKIFACDIVVTYSSHQPSKLSRVPLQLERSRLIP